MKRRLTRRDVLLTPAFLLAAAGAEARAAAPTFRLATFSADVTPPLGHPLLAGATVAPPAGRIDDRLYARGFVLHGGGEPVVVVAVDWCEIRNDAYDRWRDVLAEAVGTRRSRVLVSSVHQHDAPLPDLEAQRVLERHRCEARIFDLEFHERAVQAVAKALREGVARSRPVTRLGVGKARVKDVASNRRFLGADGRPRFDRSSMSGGDELKGDAPEGVIDPWLRTLSFWDGETPLCALSAYAVHPMSFWGTGRVTSDFPGLARERRQADDPPVFQIYASGASGNVTAGKYNDGRHDNRPALTRRLHDAMTAAWRDTKTFPLTAAAFRAAPLRLEPRDTPGFTVADLTRTLSHPDPRKQALAALGLSWRKRADAGHRLEIPAIDFGRAVLVLLPGESYVEYQLLAGKLRPDAFVVVMGYGECAPGYVATDRAWEEDDGNLRDWCWVGRSERAMTEALTAALRPE